MAASLLAVAAVVVADIEGLSAGSAAVTAAGSLAASFVAGFAAWLDDYDNEIELLIDVE